MISTLAVANRGEIAVRIVRACRELGIRSVVLHSTADRGSLAVELADDAVQIGPPAPRRSYLDVAAVIEAARRCGADAVHPGYGFLSEDADFAEICVDEGFTFVGPSPQVMAQVGDKAAARAFMGGVGLPLLPGTVEPVASVQEAAQVAAKIGYPVILKASAGGGGRGMCVVRSGEYLETAFRRTRAQAQAVFGNPAVYLERYLSGARHVEIQVLCDEHGNGVHLGERDCSIQRRHQKLLEESPCALMDARQRDRLGDLAVRACAKLGFSGVGTFEFLLDDRGDAYFMELNARIQVEHPVTEMCTGIDLVREQLLVAAGEPLGYRQSDIRFTGAAVECRVNAEDPARDFAPTPGRLTRFTPPSGPWTRVDTGYRAGDTVCPSYDSLLAKVIVWAPDRRQALTRMDRALAEFEISGAGVASTIGLHRALVRNAVFRRDEHSTTFLDHHLPTLLDPAVRVLTPATRPKGATPMGRDTFSTDDLLQLLTVKAGLPAHAHVGAGPDTTLAALGLDSLAFLSLQTGLQDAFGLELPEDRPGTDYTLGEITAYVDERLAAAVPARHADAS